MPAIHLFNRRTLSGGDDLHFPFLFASWLRVIQLFGLLIPVWFHLSYEANRMGGWFLYLLYDPSNDLSCRHSHFFPLMLLAYAIASTIVAAVGLGLELRMMQVSSWGTPTEPGNRSQKIQDLLEFKLVPFSVSEALVVFLGSIAVVGFAVTYRKCASDVNSDVWEEINRYLNGEERSLVSMLRSWSWWWVAYALLLALQLIEVLVAFFFLRGLLEQPSFAEPPSSYIPQHPIHHELSEEMWADRCESCCRGLGMSTFFFFGGRETSMGDYSAISRALADYFETGGVLDLVPSDVAAGFLVLGRIQRKRILEARSQVVSDRHLMNSPGVQDTSESLLVPQGSAESQPSTRSDVSVASRRATTYLMHQEGSQTFYEAQTRQVLSRHRATDIQTLHEGARFVRYAHAIYTWVLYVYAHPISGLPRLFCNKRGCCFCCHRQRQDDEQYDLLHEGGEIVGDSCIQAHKTALLMHSGLDEADLVYAQLKSSFSEIPYCILLDHKWKTVVLAIRGTFSLEDCVRDVLIDPEPLDQLGEEFGFDGSGQHCHGGILSCARIVHRDLQR